MHCIAENSQEVPKDLCVNGRRLALPLCLVEYNVSIFITKLGKTVLHAQVTHIVH